MDLPEVLQRQKSEVESTRAFFQEIGEAYDELATRVDEIAQKYGMNGTTKVAAVSKKRKTKTKTSDGERGAKSAAIRQYLEKNPDAKPKEVVDALSELEIKPTLVSVIKSQMKSKSGKAESKSKGRGRPGKGKDGMTYRQGIKEVLSLKKYEGGLEHGELCKVLAQRGFGGKSQEAFSNSVYQSANSMTKSEDDTPPEIVKEDRRYKLNPEAVNES
jgi:hypothetical protein